MENHLLEIKNINISYGDALAVCDVSFFVDEGKIITLVGANGAGKSTILNAISMITPPVKGEILFSGKSLAKLKPEEVVDLGISQVPEGRHLFTKLTVLENLELGAYPAKTRPYMKESLERAFNLFPVLKERIKQTAGTLSGGEQQMLAIGRALMARPSLLMLDEPSLGLAPIIVEKMFETIRTLNSEGITILLVEQNVHQALEISDYAYVLQTGTCRMQGHCEELLTNSDFRSAYLGIMGVRI
ncbi:MAG: ABC transporter ATP-binding protein [Spirochaetes bacterium]|nr:ABC transporter ATP-binding protein [Spirochaetota bacterium]